MKALHKKIVIFALSLSNLGILGLVFYTYFNNSQRVLLASSSENIADLRNKVEEECKEFMEELIAGQRSSFICNVSVNQKQKEASYIIKTRIRVTANESGQGFKIVGQGRMMEKRQHATEADFCNDCSIEREVDNNSLVDIMSEVVDTAETFYNQAQDSVREARQEYNQRDRNRRMAGIKERRCEGKWDEDAEEFEEFDLEERLSCKMDKISSIASPLEAEKFYHEELRNELWKTALSDDDYLLDDILEEFANPYRYSLSVQASSSLLKRYNDGWKDHFDILESPGQRAHFIRNRVQPYINPLLDKPEYEADLYYLNKGLENLLVQLNRETYSPQHSYHDSPNTNYDDARRQTDRF